MRLPLFTTREQKVEYCNRMADAIEQNGLKQAIENLRKAEQGYGKTEFLKINNIPEKMQESEWEHHLLFLWDEVNYLKRKVEDYRKQAQM